MTETAYIALGSNLGDRSAILASAIRAIADLDGVRLLKASSILETPPVGPDERSAPGGPYLNGVVQVETTLSPRDLLKRLLDIERSHDRIRSPRERWAPRTLDLDLLLFGDRVIDEPGLTVPHPRLHQRAFVLRPLAEIASDLVHPVLGRAVECLLRDL